MNEDAFSEMKSHILGLYEGVDAVRSFVDETGAVFDCIPIEQQPALRGSTQAVPKAPDLPPIESGDAAEGTTQGDQVEMRPSAAGSPLGPGRKDWYGNVMNCPEGTIPMRRVTLEDLTRFPTLRASMRKGPGGAGRPPRAVEPATVPAIHRWAHAYQNVNNGGGHSFLNLWRPPIGANQVFSLSQHWYVGGSGGNLQTAECGWQVYPALYGDAQPHLFCYWTPVRQRVQRLEQEDTERRAIIAVGRRIRPHAEPADGKSPLKADTAWNSNAFAGAKVCPRAMSRCVCTRAKTTLGHRSQLEVAPVLQSDTGAAATGQPTAP